MPRTRIRRSVARSAPIVLLVSTLTAVIPHGARGQNPGKAAPSSGARTSPVANAVRRDGAITIDGKLDEAAWKKAIPITELRQYQPTEGAPQSLPTEIRILYDDQAIYIGARMTQPGGVAAPLARRDQLLDANGNNGSFNSLTTDKIIIDLDPYAIASTTHGSRSTPPA